MSEPTFRAARKDDIPEIRRIARAAWAPIYAHFRAVMGEDLYAREYPGDPLERKADAVEDYFRAHPDEAFVVEVDGRVVGFCTFALRDNGVGVINNNAIAPEAQGRGLGSAMYREVLARMRAAGMVYATVHTGLDPSHAPARRAYERVGFEPIRPHVEYYLKL